jgi:hypothetical protein
MLTIVNFAANKQYFSDVSSSSPYYEAVTYLAEKGVLDSNGTDSKFRPSDKLTYYELAVIMCKTFYPNENYTAVSGSWYEPYVRQAVNSDIIDIKTLLAENNWTVNFTLDNEPVSREDYLRVLSEFALALDSKTSETAKTVTFNDSASVTADLKDYVNLALANNVCSLDSNGNLNPQANITRGDAALYLYNALKLEQKATAKTKDLSTLLPNYSSSVLISSKNLSAVQLSALTSSLEGIPSKVLKSFIKDGWKINVVDSIYSVFTSDAYKYATGLCVYSQKTIYIDKSVLVKSGIRNVVHHEMGHYFDYRFLTVNHPEANTMFSNYAKILADIMREDYCLVNENEFIAEAFAVYLSNSATAKSEMKNRIPDLWYMIDNVVTAVK